MKYLIGIILISLLASCGEATGDEKTDKSVEEEVDKSAKQIPVPSKLEGEWIFGHPYLRDDWEDDREYWYDYFQNKLGGATTLVSKGDKESTQVGEFLGNGKVRFKETKRPYRIQEGKYELEGDELSISGLKYYKNWPWCQDYNCYKRVYDDNYYWDSERGFFIKKGDEEQLIYKIKS